MKLVYTLEDIRVLLLKFFSKNKNDILEINIRNKDTGNSDYQPCLEHYRVESEHFFLKEVFGVFGIHSNIESVEILFYSNDDRMRWNLNDETSQRFEYVPCLYIKLDEAFFFASRNISFENISPVDENKLDQPSL